MNTDVSTGTMEVIWVEFLRGDGSDKNPWRYVTAYFDMNGKFLAEYDIETDGER